MRLNNLATILFSAIALTVAAPAPEASEPSELLDKREANGASCHKSSPAYTVTTWGSWDDDWGIGFLDNLRGQCGAVENWGFSYSGSSGQATFRLYKPASSNCVENAIWLASNPTGAIWGVTCTS
ncbi:hypothetical protein FRB91_007320 [Serendipita sp. 411]|nr:hypothetical protein FRB91_007320 [Serendipita sp. 411]